MASWLRFRRSPAADIHFGSRSDRRRWLPDYGNRYLEHVLAEYVTGAVPDSSPPGRIAEVVATYQAGRQVTWGDLYVLEKYVLGRQPFNALRRRASGPRANYREIMGQRAYEGYLTSRPPNENELSLEERALRADLERLLGTLHWNYTLMPDSRAPPHPHPQSERVLGGVCLHGVAPAPVVHPGTRRPAPRRHMVAGGVLRRARGIRQPAAEDSRRSRLMVTRSSAFSSS